jgi:hypothetical protein
VVPEPGRLTLADRAHQLACQQARRPKTCKLAHPAPAAQVTGWLEEWRSPAQISRRLRSDPATRQRKRLELELARAAAAITRMIEAFSEQLITIDEPRAAGRDAHLAGQAMRQAINRPAQRAGPHRHLGPG